MIVKRVHEDFRRSIDLIEEFFDDNREFTIINLKKGKAIGGCIHSIIEYMVVVEGEVFVTIGNVKEFLIDGDSRTIPPETPHMFHAKIDSKIIEFGVPASDKTRKDKKMLKEVIKINEKSIYTV